MEKVFIVICKPINSDNWAVSSEGYSTVEKAIEYIQTRYDEPKHAVGWRWDSEYTTYLIREVKIV